MKNFATMLLSCLAASAIAGAAGAQETIEFNLSWLPQGSSAGMIVAADQGYYAEEGLDVKPVRGFGGLRTINELDQGLFDFAYGNPEGIMVNRSQGGKTRLVGAINATNPAGICFFEERHDISSLEDMKGLTLGGAAGTPVMVTFPALLAGAGLPEDHVELVQLQGSVVLQTLLDGDIDIYECWQGSGKQLLDGRAVEAGLTVGFLPYEDLGLTTIGSGIATTDTVIEENPELVRKLLRATYRGYQYMQDNPEASADIVKEMFPEINRDIVLAQIVAINEVIKGPGYEEHGMGWIDPARVQKLVDFAMSTREFDTEVTPDDIYSNAYLQ